MNNKILDKASEIVKLDKDLIWHPFSQEKNSKPSINIVKGQGSYLFDEDGNRYLDLISSWWVNLHGHGNEKIADAIYKQSKKLEHVMFAGLTHQPAVELCKKLKDILPKDGLDKFFFSDNGSNAIEIAMKMSYQFWKNKGEEKKLFLSLAGDYHGDTFGAMSASKTSYFHTQFERFFYDFKFFPTPYCFNDSDLSVVVEKENKILQDIQDFLDKFQPKVAAFIVEPLIQGASGMMTYRIEFLNKLTKILKSHDIIVILDEVMTGFGRTGKIFAFNHCNFIPDMICLSKGLTGGFLPMALTITSQKIYDGFLDDSYSKAFSHGHSYTANPLGCAAAIASLDLLLSENSMNKISRISQIHIDGLQLIDDNFVKNKRNFGTISAFSIKDYIDVSNLKYNFLKNGLIVRPLGRECYVIPPYCTEEDDLLMAYKKINDILHEARY